MFNIPAGEYLGDFVANDIIYTITSITENSDEDKNYGEIWLELLPKKFMY